MNVPPEIRRRPRRWRQPRGFTLFEVVVALAVMAAIAAFLAPTVFGLLGAAREDTTETELETIYTAILGDQRTTFGYVGDVGTYPTSLLDLVRAPAGPPPGWQGPYLTVSPSEVSNQLVDEFGNPYELFVKIAATSAADALAVISRGADGVSTNTSATPNTAADFSIAPYGPPAPTSNTYLTGVNADNMVHPELDSTNNSTLTQATILGTFAPTITNFDSNANVNAVVPACPGLYTINEMSVPRKTTVTETYTPGFGTELVQGMWRLWITTPLTTDPVYSTTVTVLPGSTLIPNINFGALNSANTSSFNLTVTNKSATQSNTVYISGVATQVVPANGFATFAVKACAPIQIRNGSLVIIDQFTMPYQTYSRITGTPLRQLTINNNGVTPKLKVFDNGLAVATVRSGRGVTITVSEQDSITVTDNANATLTGTPFTMPASDSIKTCTTAGCS